MPSRLQPSSKVRATSFASRDPCCQTRNVWEARTGGVTVPPDPCTGGVDGPGPDDDPGLGRAAPADGDGTTATGDGLAEPVGWSMTAALCSRITLVPSRAAASTTDTARGRRAIGRRDTCAAARGNPAAGVTGCLGCTRAGGRSSAGRRTSVRPRPADPWDNGPRHPAFPEEVPAVSVAAVPSAAWASIAEVDPELWEAMEAERHRQADKIELIASENYTYAAVNEAQGSWLTNKYAEGLPGKRYYGGCEFVDVVENLARERALRLFPGADHVNVQPHSGAQANMAAYFSVLRPGDRILGMNLAHGGHLTHGSPVNFSGRLYEVHAYGVTRETETIDYDALERQAKEVRPKVIVGGASAY